MPSSRDMLLLFIALELVSAPGFLMAAFRKNDPKSNEAGLKFFLIGVLSTAVMLYGMSLIYGLTGATRLDAIARGLANIDAAKETLAFCAILFVVIGLRVQGLGGALPVLGARYVRGSARSRGGVPGRRLQRSRIRRAAAAHVRGLHQPTRVLDADLRRPVDRHDDVRQPRGAQADAGGAAAGVFGHRPGRIHLAAVRLGLGRCRGEPFARSPRRSHTS